MPEPDLVKRFTARDGARRLDILRAAEGTFRYVSYRWMPAAPEDEGVLGEGHWLAEESSGLFDDAGRCERDARAELDWLARAAD
jgi:hypothetical protein